MKNSYSKTWKSSKKPAKQRKYKFNAPLHIKKKFLRAPLSKMLKEKFQKKTITIKKGDKVKILRGDFKGKVGNVEKVSHIHSKVFVQGITRDKKDGSKVQIALEASNLIITELNVEDKKRIGNQNGKEASKKNSSK